MAISTVANVASLAAQQGAAVLTSVNDAKQSFENAATKAAGQETSQATAIADATGKLAKSLEGQLAGVV